MQNQQLTPTQTNLQQSTTGLQPNSGQLQQGGSPTASSDATTVLNQPLSTDLSVQSAETQVTDTPQTYLPNQSPVTEILTVLLVIVLVATFAAWSRLRKTETVELAVPDEQPKPTPLVKSKAAAKKPKFQKKTTRRQRTRKS